jgi:hypothetical protein
VGWKTSDRCDTDLILAALEYGIWSRDTRDGELIHHSDRGSNYTSFRFAERLRDNGILPSMGSVGDSYDTQSSMVVEERRLGRLTRHTSGPEWLRHDDRRASSRGLTRVTTGLRVPMR